MQTVHLWCDLICIVCVIGLCLCAVLCAYVLNVLCLCLGCVFVFECGCGVAEVEW